MLVQTQVDVSRKPANAPQEKLKEALALVHELKETLAQTVKHNQNTSVKQDQMKVVSFRCTLYSKWLLFPRFSFDMMSVIDIMSPLLKFSLCTPAKCHG